MQKVIVKLTCDLPHPQEVAATETIRFTLNGSAFELDSCADDAKKLRATMAPFTGAARPEVRAKPQKKNAQVVRKWAAAHGMPVGARGRIPAQVKAAYAAGQADKPAERAAMTVIQGKIDPTPPVVLREPDISAAANGAAAKPVSARKPRVGKPAGESAAKAAAV